MGLAPAGGDDGGDGGGDWSGDGRFGCADERRTNWTRNHQKWRWRKRRFVGRIAMKERWRFGEPDADTDDDGDGDDDDEGLEQEEKGL